MSKVIFPHIKELINESFIPLWKNTDRYLLLWGGRGSSKSEFAARKKVYECLTQNYFRCILIRDTYATIKDSQYQTIKDVVNSWNLQSEFTFKENPLEIRCNNGNIFYARGCDDVEKIKSIKDPSGAWYEEANKIKENDFLTITTSIRTTKAEYLQELFTFNPECDGKPEDHWINKIFLKGRNEKFVSDNLEIKLPTGETLSTPFTTHHSTYTDNRWCSVEFIAFLENLRTINPYYYDVYCKGLWGQKIGNNPFANHYNPSLHESESAKEDPTKKLFIVCDFNLNPFAFTFAHIWKDDKGEHHHIFNEVAFEGGSIPNAIEWIKQKYEYYLPTCSISGDHMGDNANMTQSDLASIFTQLQRGLGLSRSQVNVVNNPGHITSRNDVNYFLIHYPDFKINPRSCPNTSMDMRSVQCDIYGKIIKRDRKELSQRADFLDCVRYSVNTYQKPWIENHRKRNRNNLLTLSKR